MIKKTLLTAAAILAFSAGTANATSCGNNWWQSPCPQEPEVVVSSNGNTNFNLGPVTAANVAVSVLGSVHNVDQVASATGAQQAILGVSGDDNVNGNAAPVAAVNVQASLLGDVVKFEQTATAVGALQSIDGFDGETESDNTNANAGPVVAANVAVSAFGDVGGDEYRYGHGHYGHTVTVVSTQDATALGAVQNLSEGVSNDNANTGDVLAINVAGSLKGDVGLLDQSAVAVGASQNVSGIGTSNVNLNAGRVTAGNAAFSVKGNVSRVNQSATAIGAAQTIGTNN